MGEINQNPMPEVMPNFNLFPRISALASFVVRKMSVFPNGVDLSLSEHKRGAEAMLDALQDQQEFSTVLADHKSGGWDSEGCYWTGER